MFESIRLLAACLPYVDKYLLHVLPLYRLNTRGLHFLKKYCKWFYESYQFFLQVFARLMECSNHCQTQFIGRSFSYVRISCILKGVLILWSIPTTNHWISNCSSILYGIWHNRALSLLSYSRIDSPIFCSISLSFWAARCLTSCVLRKARKLCWISHLDLLWFYVKSIYQVSTLFLNALANWAIFLASSVTSGASHRVHI